MRFHNAENIITLYDEAIACQYGSILRDAFQSTGRLCYRHYQCLFQYIGIKNVQVNGGLDLFRFLIFSLLRRPIARVPLRAGWWSRLKKVMNGYENSTVFSNKIQVQKNYPFLGAILNVPD